MEEVAAHDLAGLAFVGQVPFSNEDLEFLKRFVRTRKEKIKRGKTNLCTTVILCAPAAWLLISGYGQTALLLIGLGILLISSIFTVQYTLSYRRQQLLLEADLEQNYLLRFEGKITNSEHWLIKNALLSNDKGRVQKIEILPVSGKVHRTNNSLLWTWFNIKNESRAS